MISLNKVLAVLNRHKFIWIFLLVAVGMETWLAYNAYQGMNPFPYDEVSLRVVDHSLRDGLLGVICWALYFRRKRVPDRIKRYFPVVVLGVLYLGIAIFMVRQLSLDWGLKTTLSVLAGINNNIFFVLVAAMCYHKWPTRVMKGVYFVVYFFTALTMVFDAFYFWQTSMHVESVLFQNLNIYAAKGVFATMDTKMIGGIAVAIIVLLILFHVTKPERHKPNFAWSLLCVAMFTIGLNIADRVLGALSMYAVQNIVGVYVEVENEKTRSTYRNLLSVPVNVNFVSKALFDTDKMAGSKHVEQRELTDKDKETLTKLGIPVTKAKIEKIAPQYDRVVLLILESVHRDYLSCYNELIPSNTTPFLDSLIANYPHLDKYYSSSVPTTQGLNATFRSHLIMDKDVPGNQKPSLFRSVQEAGMRGIFMNASSQYYANELREYPDQFGMKEYYAKEYLEKQGYSGASGWGFHNDVMYAETIKMLERGKNDRLLMVTKTLDMHQPYPYTGYSWNEMPEGVRDNANFTVRGMYWVDKTLEKFFKEAEAHGLMDDRTLFIITSDHNPHSGGEYKTLVTKEDDKRSIAPLPLIFVSKNTEPLRNLQTKEYASQIDLAPTLLYLLGIDVPELFMGRNLLQPVETPYALGYFGGKAYFWSDKTHFIDKMDEPVPETEEQDALTNYIIHYYGLWH